MNKIIERIMHMLFYSCEKATFLIEKKASAQSIGIIENMRLKGHLAMCKFCRAYNNKVSIIDKTMTNISNKSSKEIEETEIKDFKTQLKIKTLK